MNVSDNVKQSYRITSVKKTLVIEFPELEQIVTDENIYSESLELEESVVDTESIEFVGCISSKLKVQIRDFGVDIKGKKINVSIHTEDTVEEPIPLFVGIIDTAKLQSNHKIKEIVAYDELYTAGNTDIATWYNNLVFPLTLKNFRDSLFTYLNILQEEVVLPNDELQVKKNYSPNTLQATSVIKSICQINGVFGIINRYGNFEYRTLPNMPEDVDPEEETAVEVIGPYKNLEYQEFIVKPVDKVTIRKNEDDAGVSFGLGDNNYIIQGNIFTKGLTKPELLQLAENIYYKVVNISYTPFIVTNAGYPWIECGKNIVQYEAYDFDNSTETEDVYKSLSLYVFSRHLTGIQDLKDEYSAEGEEYQSEFITDVNLQIDDLRDKIREITESVDTAQPMKYYDFISDMAVTINNHERKRIIKIAYTTERDTHLDFHAEVKYTITTVEDTSELEFYTEHDAIIRVYYYLNGQEILEYHPIQTELDGVRLLHLLYFWNGLANFDGVWEVYLEADGCIINVGAGDARAYLAGTGLKDPEGGGIWDGFIEASDTIGLIDADWFALPFTDSVNVTQPDTSDQSPSDTLSLLSANDWLLGFSDYVGSVQILRRFDPAHDTDVVTLNNAKRDGSVWKVIDTGSPGTVTTEIVYTNNISQVTAVTSGTDVFFIASFDGGSSWWAYQNSWSPVDYSQDVYGMFADTLSSVPASAWNSKLSGSIMIQGVIVRTGTLTDIQIYAD